MAPINPLNVYAEGMVSSVAKKSPAAPTYIKRFFNTANTENQQGTALVAYYTELNKLSRTPDFTRIPALIEQEVRKIPELAKEAKAFVRALNETYPNSLEKRVSLASQGAVVSDKVEPKSKLKRFLISINNCMKPEE